MLKNQRADLKNQRYMLKNPKDMPKNLQDRWRIHWDTPWNRQDTGGSTRFEREDHYLTSTSRGNRLGIRLGNSANSEVPVPGGRLLAVPPAALTRESLGKRYETGSSVTRSSALTITICWPWLQKSHVTHAGRGERKGGRVRRCVYHKVVR